VLYNTHTAGDLAQSTNPVDIGRSLGSGNDENVELLLFLFSTHLLQLLLSTLSQQITNSSQFRFNITKFYSRIF
jgi:hypothetical protein